MEVSFSVPTPSRKRIFLRKGFKILFTTTTEGNKLSIRMFLPGEAAQTKCSGDPLPELSYKATPGVHGKQPVLQDCTFIKCPGKNQDSVIRPLMQTAEIPAELC